jgi:hypothetical protein
MTDAPAKPPVAVTPDFDGKRSLSSSFGAGEHHSHGNTANRSNGDAMSITSGEFPQQVSFHNANPVPSTKTKKKVTFQNLAKTMTSRQFGKIAACCFEAGVAGWNGENLIGPMYGNVDSLQQLICSPGRCMFGCPFAELRIMV